MKNRRLLGPVLIAMAVALGTGACSSESTAQSNAKASSTAESSATASATAEPSATESPTAGSTGEPTVLKVASMSFKSGGKESVLVTDSGQAVYMLTGDSTDDPQCVKDACTSFWIPVTSSTAKPEVGDGVTGKVEVWHHDGIDQQTIDGHPLYTFGGDKTAGTAGGQGLSSFGGTWKALTASGSAVE